MIDVLMTTYNRLSFLKQTITSLFQSAGSVPFRLSVIDDCSTDGTREWLHSMRFAFHKLVLSEKRQGIVTNFNVMWDLLMFDPEYPYLCYMQDDLVSEVDRWLDILLETHKTYADAYSVGFSTAYDAREHVCMHLLDHPMYPSLRIKIKRSTSMQNLLAEKWLWNSIGKPPELTYDGTVRGFPNDGRGSDIDVWFTGYYSLNRFDRKSHSPNCLALQGKTVLAMPMLIHMGAEKKDSTWRQNRTHGF